MSAIPTCSCTYWPRSVPSPPGCSEMRALAFAGENAHAVARQAQRAVAAADPATASMLVELVDAVADFQEHDAQFTLDDLLADLVLGGGGRPPRSAAASRSPPFTRTKGLEWPTVFMLGLEEGHMPDYKCEGEDQLLEERRWCFVGACRAEDELILTFAQRFRSHSRSRSAVLGRMAGRGEPASAVPLAQPDTTSQTVGGDRHRRFAVHGWAFTSRRPPVPVQ